MLPFIIFGFLIVIGVFSLDIYINIKDGEYYSVSISIMRFLIDVICMFVLYIFISDILNIIDVFGRIK